MLAASTARPGGTPFGQRHRHRGRRGEAVLVRMQHEDVAARAARPGPRRHARPRRSRTSPGTESSPPAAAPASGPARRAARRPAQHQRLGAAADAAEARLDQHVARPRQRHASSRSSAAPGATIQSAVPYHAAIPPIAVAGDHTTPTATNGRKAVRFGRPSWPIGNTTTALHRNAAQFLIAAGKHRIEVCDYRTRVLIERRGLAMRQGMNRSIRYAILLSPPTLLAFAGGVAAQGLPPIQREFSNGSVAAVLRPDQQGRPALRRRQRHRELLPDRQRQLRHPRRPQLHPGVRRLDLRERQRVQLRAVLDRQRQHPAGLAHLRGLRVLQRQHPQARLHASPTTATASSGSARAAWRPTASSRSTSPAPTSSPIPASPIPPAPRSSASATRRSPTTSAAPQIFDVFANLDGDRRVRVRYDSPGFANFTVAVAFGRDLLSDDSEVRDQNIFDASVNYANNYGDVEVEAGLGYNWQDDDTSRLRRLGLGAASRRPASTSPSPPASGTAPAARTALLVQQARPPAQLLPQPRATPRCRSTTIPATTSASTTTPASPARRATVLGRSRWCRTSTAPTPSSG